MYSTAKNIMHSVISSNFEERWTNEKNNYRGEREDHK